MLEILILGALMGLLGQGARTVVGLKGMSDDAQAQGLSPNDLFIASRLLTSLLIGFLVGLAAALIYIIKNGADPGGVTAQVLIGFAASGYIGVDFLETFIAQYLPTGSKPTAKAFAAAAAKPGVQKPTYPPDQAQSIVFKAFTGLGYPSVKPTDTLSSLNIKSNFDLLNLLEAVNGQIPDKTHLLPIGAIINWSKVSDVIASVVYAPTNPAPSA